MKLALLLLLASLLVAETHNFREVNFNGKTLKNVRMTIKDNKFDIWQNERLIKQGAYMIISCRTRERFCLVENKSNYGWIGDK